MSISAAPTNVVRPGPGCFAFSPKPNKQSAPGFEILAELGRGGMGVVYKARQTALNRIVALKMVLAGSHSHESDRLRFLAEAEAVAAVRHPNVVQVYEFGVNDNLPYFAMEYLDSGSLARMLVEHGRLGAEAAARIVEQVARGVQAAHDVGVIHRDLKPGNILFAGDRRQGTGDSKKSGQLPGALPTPDSCPLTPVVTDFGLAKRGGGYDLTLTGVVMGTPAYMAPEQAKGEGKFVGPPADIYALGVILYECLASRPPFMGEEQGAVLLRVVSEDPPSVRRFNPDVPLDLELICMKCLEKAPAARYPSAGALAEDLRRYLSGEPVSIRPAGNLEKVVKWVRRYPSRAALYGLTMFAAALIGLTAGVVDLWRNAEAGRQLKTDALNYALSEQEKAEQARVAAETEKAKAQQAQTDADTARVIAVQEKAAAERAREGEARARAARSVDLAFREYELSNITQARRYLDDCPPALRHWEWHFIDRLCHREARVITTGASMVFDVGFHPQTGTLITAGSHGLREWNPASGDQIKAMPGTAFHLSISGDGKRVAAMNPEAVTIRDLTTGKPIVAFAGSGLFIALNQDGTTLLIGGEGKAAIRNVEERNELPVRLGDFTGYCGAMSPNDEWVAIGGAGVGPKSANRVPMVKFIPVNGRGEAITLTFNTGVSVRSVAFDPTSQKIAAGCEDGSITICQFEDRKAQNPFRVPTGTVMSLAFSPDGKRLAAAAADRTARVWDIDSTEELFVLKGHTHALNSVAFSPDGSKLATGSLDGTARLWDMTAPPDCLRLEKLSGQPVVAVTMTEDRSRVVVAGGGQVTLRVYNGRTGELLWGTREPAGSTLSTVSISPDSQRVIASDETGQVREWDLQSGALRTPWLTPGTTLKQPVRLSADRSRAVGWSEKDWTVTVHDVRSGSILSQTGNHAGMKFRPTISPDGKRILTSELDRTGRVWDAETGKELLSLSGHVWPFRAAAFSPDGSRIATAGTEGWLKVWDAADGREVMTFQGRNRTLLTVGFSQNGTKLLTLDSLGTLNVHDAGK